MRKRNFLTILLFFAILPLFLTANFRTNLKGPGKDINGTYKNSSFELKINNYDEPSGTFSFELKSVPGVNCALSLEGTATRLILGYSNPDKVRYEYKDANGCRYFFTVFSGENASVDLMQYDCKGAAVNSCLQDQGSSKLSFDNKN